MVKFFATVTAPSYSIALPPGVGGSYTHIKLLKLIFKSPIDKKILFVSINNALGGWVDSLTYSYMLPIIQGNTVTYSQVGDGGECPLEVSNNRKLTFNCFSEDLTVDNTFITTSNPLYIEIECLD